MKRLILVSTLLLLLLLLVVVQSRDANQIRGTRQQQRRRQQQRLLKSSASQSMKGKSSSKSQNGKKGGMGKGNGSKKPGEDQDSDDNENSIGKMTSIRWPVATGDDDDDTNNNDSSTVNGKKGEYKESSVNNSQGGASPMEISYDLDQDSNSSPSELKRAEQETLTDYDISSSSSAKGKNKGNKNGSESESNGTTADDIDNEVQETPTSQPSTDGKQNSIINQDGDDDDDDDDDDDEVVIISMKEDREMKKKKSKKSDNGEGKEGKKSGKKGGGKSGKGEKGKKGRKNNNNGGKNNNGANGNGNGNGGNSNGNGNGGGITDEIAASQKLRDAVTSTAISNHMQALQDAAERTVGTRSVGTVGYDESLTYIVRTLKEEQAYSDGDSHFITIQNFTVDLFEILQPSQMSRAGGMDFVYGLDFFEFDFIRSAQVEAPTQVIEGNGCNDGDYADFPRGRIAVMIRVSHNDNNNDDGIDAECNFRVQSIQAENAGASGVIIYNDEEQQEAFFESFHEYIVDIPVFGASFTVGMELGTGTVIRMFSNVLNIEDVPTSNVIAEITASGDNGDNSHPVIVAGAHLDSVANGAGINANGSGCSTLLEIAVQMSKLSIVPLTHTIRFIWFGAGEVGWKGSMHYVTDLTPAQQDSIAVYLNFDILASPNYVRVVYAPELDGEEALSNTMISYFGAMNLTIVPLDNELASVLNGRSDHSSFRAVGIPSNGLYTGDITNKTEDLFQLFQGTVGAPLDPCYHMACDLLNNVNLTVLEEMSDAAAHFILTFANRDTLDFRSFSSSTSSRRQRRIQR